MEAARIWRPMVVFVRRSVSAAKTPMARRIVTMVIHRMCTPAIVTGSLSSESDDDLPDRPEPDERDALQEVADRKGRHQHRRERPGAGGEMQRAPFLARERAPPRNRSAMLTRTGLSLVSASAYAPAMINWPYAKLTDEARRRPVRSRPPLVRRSSPARSNRAGSGCVRSR